MRRKPMIRAIAAFTAVIMLLVSLPLQALAEVINTEDTTSIRNGFIQATVDNKTGRFSIRTEEGQPIRKKDNGVDMIYGGDNPETSFTTFRIDGTDLIFGNPYKLAPNWESKLEAPKAVTGTDGTQSLVTVWTIKGIRISQVITLILKDDKEQGGNVRVQYVVDNESSSTVEIGSRVLLDTSVGGNDGPAFQIGQNYSVPLTVERKLVHEPETLGYDKTKDEQAYNLHKLPAYWVMRDKLDPTNPLATNVIAYGFNNLFEGGINIVDEMVVGHWANLAGSKWDYEPDENLDFTLDTNDYGTADTAVAYYWNPDQVAAGAQHSFELVYGLGEIIAPEKVFDVRFLDPTQKLETNAEESGYVNDGIFEVNAEIENLELFGLSHSQIDVTLTLENGLSFVDENGQKLGSSSQKLTFRKDISPEDATKGIENIPYKPGETVAAKWRIKGSGKAWPSTRQYMVTVSSPETEKKLETAISESEGMPETEIRAIYESSRANFIFLPPVGELRQTLVYAMSPEETFDKDEKYISLNVSNIAAYNVGSEATSTAANFDMYLVNAKNGDRYKVPVTRSVTAQALGNGFAGDLKLVYRGGEKVDANGTTLETLEDSTLPLGEYKVQLDYRDKTIPEVSEALSFTTEQTFAVTQNEENRVRQAGILAVYKTALDLNSGAGDKDLFADVLPLGYSNLSDADFKTKLDQDRTKFTAARQEMVAASRKLDPALDIAGALDPSASPVYTVKTFETEKQFEEFADELDEDAGQEIVLEARGKIVQSGTGANAQYTIRADTEPVILNKSVAYSGKDLTLSFGKFALAEELKANTETPFLQTLFVGGDGTLSVANSGFVFHSGEWTVDFYNGFDKSLGTDSGLSDEEQAWEEGRNPEDPTLNGSLSWANGMVADALNPYRTLLVSYVYFNKHTLFSTPTFSVAGFGLKLNDFVLREDGVAFGGAVKMYIVNGEVNSVMFNQSGFVGIDSALNFELGEGIGLIKESDDGDQKIAGGINIVHYKDPNKYDVMNSYGISFEGKLENLFSISAELAFKRVPDGRIIPDVIAFGSDLPEPGIMINPAIKISALRGAIRELAMTIAGGTERIPLTLEAGVDMELGKKPAVFTGAVDLTLKATGFKILGTLDYGSGDDTLPMLTEALVQTQWVSPMFIRARAQLDVGGWDIIIGSASLFIGENLEKGRVDFEGMVSSKIQIPGSVPVVGGMGFGVRAGANNDQLWAGISLLFLTLGIKYYWGGGISFMTDGSHLDNDALINLAVNDPEQGPRLLQIGTGIQTLATSWENEETDRYEIRYTAVAEGIDMIEDSSQDLGIGGIRTSDGGKKHIIPTSDITGNALLEVEYFTTTRPTLTLKRADGSSYDIVFGDVTDKTATAFEQIIKAPKEGDLKSDGTKVTKKEEQQGTDTRRVYIALPQSDANTGDWTLTSSQSVKSKLMNIPVLPSLSAASLATDAQDGDKFTAHWTVAHASPGDTVDLYLSADQLQAVPTADESIDPGIMIAKGIEVASGDIAADGSASGEMSFDVNSIEYLGGADLRGLIQQGDYYLRAELKTESAFDAKSSQEAYTLVDPLAPNAVDSVDVTSIGNGMFDVSFPASVKPTGVENDAFTYVLTATDEQNVLYDPFGEEGYEEEDLQETLQDGRYHVTVGGWNELGTPKLGADGKILRNADGTIVMEEGEVRHSGLEPGKTYRMGVMVARKPVSDANANMRLSAATYSAPKLLPAPQGPELTLDGKKVVDNKHEVITNSNEISVGVTSPQSGVIVEASTDDGVLGTYDLSKTNKMDLKFEVDGVYAVQLKARNKTTGDTSVTMLYVTIDKVAPMIYLDAPLPGARAANGAALLQGTTMTDATVTVTDADTDAELAQFKPDENGVFKQNIALGGDKLKTRLRIKTEDAAGNVNSAVVEVLNDNFKLPRRLKLEMPEAVVAGGQTAALKTYVEYTDGTRELLDNADIAYSVVMGEANAGVEQNGAVAGKRVGAALIQADYEWQGTELSVTDVVSVTAPEAGSAPPDYMDTVKASTVGTGKAGETRVSINAAGHGGNMVGSEWAYKVFSDAAQVLLPTFEQNASSWTALPTDKIVKAKPGEQIVVVKRTTAQPKLVTASSAAIAVNEWIAPASTGGGSSTITKPASNVPKGPLTIGGIAVDAKVGGKDIKVPLQLDGTQTDGLMLVDVTPGASGPTIVAHPVREALLSTIKRGQQITLRVTGELERLGIELDADLVNQLAAKGVSLNLESDWGSYRLGLDAIDTDAVVSSFPGENAENIKIVLNVGQAADLYAQFAEQLTAEGITVPRGVPVAFDMTASNGKRSISIERFAKMTEKELRLPVGEDDRTVSTVVVMEQDGSLRHVPTRFEAKDGIMYAVASTLTNSVYLPVKHTAAFRDLEGHWAEEAISDLSSRLIVNGVSATRFDPSRSMSRAELAALMARAFGLKSVSDSNASFADVKSTDWYNDAVRTATEYGLMSGYSGSRFGPKDVMTREQAMVMLMRAYELAGKAAPSAGDTASALNSYADAASLSDWAKTSAAQAVKLGLIQGKSAGKLEPKAPVTRAEMTMLVRRLLTELELM